MCWPGHERAGSLHDRVASARTGGLGRGSSPLPLGVCVTKERSGPSQTWWTGGFGGTRLNGMGTEGQDPPGLTARPGPLDMVPARGRGGHMGPAESLCPPCLRLRSRPCAVQRKW